MSDGASKLLVSVRHVEEAKIALAGGADLIDVKEPARGALGRADDVDLAAIREAISGRRPVSAALGELVDFDGRLPAGFGFLKCGLSRAGDDWRSRWTTLRVSAGDAEFVVVAYADWRCAEAPSLDDVVDFACRQPEPILLIDTGCKHASKAGRRATLLDWISIEELQGIIDRIHGVGGRIALAGSLSADDLPPLARLRADWIAVRGAACRDGDRLAGIDADRVRRLKQSLDA
jgi:uncharacterized protein (UPF0264 family)